MTGPIPWSHRLNLFFLRGDWISTADASKLNLNNIISLRSIEEIKIGYLLECFCAGSKTTWSVVILETSKFERRETRVLSLQRSAVPITAARNILEKIHACSRTNVIISRTKMAVPLMPLIPFTSTLLYVFLRILKHQLIIIFLCISSSLPVSISFTCYYFNEWLGIEYVIRLRYFRHEDVWTPG